ncbi:MAG: Rrf2 family transcriptional regulator [Clostridia bacterium]|nr:Rrf2 family transcriptional regulator [Clostridia bacterium]
MISTKGRYALRVMLDIAEHYTDDFIPLKTIAERQEISKKYLEIIVKDLVRANLLAGSSGKGGGYKLLKRPEDYSVGEILEATEGPLITVACLAEGAAECPRAKFCKTLPLWTEYEKMLHDFFFSKKLVDLL